MLLKIRYIICSIFLFKVLILRKAQRLLNKRKTEISLAKAVTARRAERAISFCAFCRHQSRVNPFAVDVPNRSAFQMFPNRIRAGGRGLKIRFAAHASFLFRASSLLHERSVSDETCTPARLASSSH